jgi:hypothetical protein
MLLAGGGTLKNVDWLEGLHSLMRRSKNSHEVRKKPD